MNPLFLAGLALLTLITDGGDSPLPRVRPLEPAEALRSFRVREGFRMDLLAAEPLVADPVAAAYDEDGRLYVAEMGDYPHVVARHDRPFTENLGDPPAGRVRVLVDRDGDGVFDQSWVFADRLSWPTGVVVWKGGVFVTATPDIWYLKDTDGDHRADVRTKVFTGFRKFNVQAVMNNPQWGLDHWIYAAGSSNGGEVRAVSDPGAAPVNLLRRDFRFHPTSDRFEAIPGGARFGNTFDDWGNRFVCDIRNPAQHVVLPAQSLARNPYLPIPRVLHDAAESGDAITLFRISRPEPWRKLRARRWAAVGKAVPRSELVAAGYLTSSSGVTVYRGDAYPASFRGQFFLGEVANNLVHRMTVNPDGVTFRAARADEGAEFLASTDTWFRPVNFVNAPDGTLHVLDMYRETIEHPWSIPDDIRAQLDLRSGADRGRIFRLTPPGFRPRRAPSLGRASASKLVALLEHPNAWHRETAHRLIYERQDRTAVPRLKILLHSGKEPLGRLHALYSLDGLGSLTDDDLRRALDDPAPHVREHAVILAAPRAHRELADALRRRATDPDLRVRFRVALAVGDIIDDVPAITTALATIARRDANDAWVRTAVLSSTADPAGLLDRLWSEPGLVASEPGVSLFRSLAVVVGAQDRPATVERVVARVAGSGPADAADAVILGLGEGLARSGRRLDDHLATLTREVGVWLDQRFTRAARTAADTLTPTDLRARAVTLTALAGFDRANAILPDLLNAGQPPAVQAAAVRALAGFDQPEVAGILLHPWNGYTPGLRAEVVAVLLGRHPWVITLLDAVRDGTVPALQITPSRRALLLKDRDPAVRERANRLFAALLPGPRVEAITRYRPVLDHVGDPEKGRAVFDRECVTCHKLGERGHSVGPNLAGVRRKTPEEILVSILDPNREVSPEFLEYIVALDDGRVVTGLIADETPTGLTLRAREGAETTVLRRNVAEIRSTSRSLMPEGLETSITPAEMSDLIAFLLKLQD